MRKTLFVLLLLFVMCLSVQARTIVAAADPWRPFVDPDNPTEGLSLEIIRAAYKTQGYEVEMKFIPWARAEHGVREGIYDILPPTWRTAEREKYLMYSDPYAYNEVKFIKRKGDPFEYEGLNSLTGKTIGTMRGYGYGTEFLQATNFIRDDVSEFSMNIRKLLADRIDLSLEDEIVARYTIAQELPEMLKEIEFTNNYLTKHSLHVTSGIKNPRHKEIIEAFNRGLKIIKEDGTYSEIMKKYGITN